MRCFLTISPESSSCSGLDEDNDDAAVAALFEADEAEDSFNALYQAVELYDGLREAARTEHTREEGRRVEAELNKPSERALAPALLVMQKHAGVHKSNILAVAAHPAAHTHHAYTHVVATAAADKSIRVTDTESKRTVCVVPGDAALPSVALSLDWHPTRPDLLLAGCINGAVVLLRIDALADYDPAAAKDVSVAPPAPAAGSSATDASSAATDAPSAAAAAAPGFCILQQWKPHGKYCVAARWAVDGESFVTGAHDCLLVVFKRDKDKDSASAASTVEGVATGAGAGAGCSFSAVKTLRFKGQVEAVERVPPCSAAAAAAGVPEAEPGAGARESKGDDDGGSTARFVVAVRDDNYLHIVDAGSAAGVDNAVGEVEGARINMNERGDDHVSFTALSLATSPSGGLLLVANDHNRVMLFDLRTKRLLRNYYGAANGDMSTPRVAWGGGGTMRYVYVSTEDSTVFVWDSENARPAGVLKGGHGKRLRDMAPHPTLNRMITVSFDQSIVVWAPEKA